MDDRAPALLLAFGVSLAAGYLWPPAALPAALVLLFFAPGYALASKFAPLLGGPEKIGVSIVASVIFSTHCVNVLSLAFGYSKEIVFAALGALSLAVLAIDLRTLERELQSLAALKHAVAPALLAFLFVSSVLAASLWKPTETGIINGGWNWSDFLFHHAIIKSIAAGNFPPQAPHFAGAPLIYHYFADFHTAIAFAATSISPVSLAVFSQGLLAFALSLVGFGAANYLLRSHKAAFFATVFLVFGGGLGYLALANDVLSGKDFFAQVKSHSFDNNWDSSLFKIPSVMGVSLLTHRASTVGLPTFVATVLLLLLALDSHSRKAAVFAGFLCALLAPFHFYAFMAAVLACGILVALRLPGSIHPSETAARPRTVQGSGAPLKAGGPLSLGLHFAAPLALALPFALAPLFYATAGGFLKLNLGWESGAHDAVEFIRFYFFNFGVPVALALCSIAFTEAREKRFLFLSALALFAIPNVVSFSAVSWDMNKFFHFMWVPVAVLAGLVASRLDLRIASFAVLLSVLSPLLVSAWFVSMDWQALSNDDLAVAGWMEESTSIKNVFVTPAFINQPTDAAGRLRLSTFGPYVANTGFDPREREADIKSVYCATDAATATSLMRKYGASHVLVNSRGGECEPAAFDLFSSSKEFSLAFQAGGLGVFELKGAS